MSLIQALNEVDSNITDPRKGLPEEVFEFVSKVTPMINVDLLIQDIKGRVLLAWRDDEFCGKGWHIPGGIIRYKETIEERIHKIAESELKAKVTFDIKPLAVNEIIMPQNIRGHFISLLIRCYVSEDYCIDNSGKNNTAPGYLKWHKHMPSNLVRGQKDIYHNII